MLTQKIKQFKWKLPTSSRTPIFERRPLSFRAALPLLLVASLFYASGGGGLLPSLFAQEEETRQEQLQLSENPAVASQQIRTTLAQKKYTEVLRLCQEAEQAQMSVPLLSTYRRMAEEKLAEAALKPTKTPTPVPTTPVAATPRPPTSTPLVSQTPAPTPASQQPNEAPAGSGFNWRELQKNPYAIGAAAGFVGFLLIFAIVRRKKAKAAIADDDEETSSEGASQTAFAADVTEQFDDNSFQSMDGGQSASPDETLALLDDDEPQGGSGEIFIDMAQDEAPGDESTVDQHALDTQALEARVEESGERGPESLAEQSDGKLDLDQLVKEVKTGPAEQRPAAQPEYGLSAMEADTAHPKPKDASDELPRSGLLDQTPQDQPPLELPTSSSPQPAPKPAAQAKRKMPEQKKPKAKKPPAPEPQPAPEIEPGLDDSFVGGKTAVNVMARQEALFQDQYVRGVRAMEKENWKDAIHYLGVALALDDKNEEVQAKLKTAREKRRAEQG